MWGSSMALDVAHGVFSSGRSLVTSASTTASALVFTPEAAAMGGLILGIATLAKLVLTGRVLGLSGSMRGITQGDMSPWRFAFLGGMAMGAVATNLVVPTAYDVFPPSATLARMAVSGLLVGLGSALANGCTSGHSICGNSRLSKRSLTFTACFMGAGMVAATLTNTLGALGVPPVSALAAYQAGNPLDLQAYAMVAGASVATFALLGLLGKIMQPAGRAAQAFEVAAEVTVGFFFALGLGICGMTHPGKLAGFLSPLNAAWDPSLAFVMGSAILVSALAYNSVPGSVLKVLPAPLDRPAFTPSWALPSLASPIDRRLVLGGLIFGLGVGASGLCPGPDIVNVAAACTPQTFAHIAMMNLGFILEPWLTKALPFLSAKPKPAVA